MSLVENFRHVDHETLEEIKVFEEVKKINGRDVVRRTYYYVGQEVVAIEILGIDSQVADDFNVNSLDGHTIS